MNIDINECHRWAYKYSNKILNVLREGNWTTSCVWTTIGPILSDFVLQDDGLDSEDKKTVAEGVVNRWCAFIRSSCDPNLPDHKRETVFNKCAKFSHNLANVLKEELSNELDVYIKHSASLLNPSRIATKIKTPK